MKAPLPVRLALEAAAVAERFSGPGLVTAVRGVFAVMPALEDYVARTLAPLAPAVRRYALSALLRNTFLIEPANEAVKSTKVHVRWTSLLESDDPRKQDFESCWKLFAVLLYELSTALESPENAELLEGFCATKLLSYELPLDYQESLSRPIHHADNLRWDWSQRPRRLLALRKIVRDSAGEGEVLAKLLDDKIMVKTYLTDRAQTGTYKTNREKRWEAHPGSVQFALRRECWAIETKLVMRLAQFTGFPAALARRFQDGGFTLSAEPARCPITKALLDFHALSDQVKNPRHGKSGFQVGHLNPLKASVGDTRFRHTAENIDWLSEDGNRIQGSLTQVQVRALLRDIAQGYAEIGDPLV